MSGPASIEGCRDVAPWASRFVALTARSPKRAVALAQRWYRQRDQRTPQEQALVAYLLGYALMCWERFDAADEYFARAETLAETRPGERFALDLQRCRLFIGLLRGGGAGQAAVWLELAHTYEVLGCPLSSARARLAMMGQLNLQGLGRSVLDIAKSIEPIFEHYGAVGDRAWLKRLSAVAILNLGAFDETMQALETAATLFALLDQRGELVKTCLEYARCYELQGELTRALSELEAAYQLAQALDLPLRMAFCEKNLGWISALHGAYDRAILLSLRAYERFAQLKRPDALADCDLNLGNIAYYAGMPELALSAYQRAEHVYAQLDHQRMLLLCRHNQALVLRLAGQLTVALERVQTLVPLAEHLGEQIEQAEANYALGQILADLGMFPQSREAFVLAEQQFRSLQNDPSVGRCLLEQGWLCLRQNDAQQAAHYLRTAQALLQGRPIHQWRLAYGLARCAELQAAPQAALQAYKEACLIVARLRQRLANEHASSGLFAQARQLVADALSLAWGQRDGEALLQLSELQHSLALLTALRSTHVRELRQQVKAAQAPMQPEELPSAQERSERSEQARLLAYLEQRLRHRHIEPIADEDLLLPLDLPALRTGFAQAFPQGWTLLVYLPCDDQLVIVSMDAETLCLEATVYDERLRWLLKRATTSEYRDLTYLRPASLASAAMVDAERISWPVLSELGQRLIPQRVSASFSPECRLLIVASGALHGLFWSALRVGERWLVEQITPQLLPGLQIWQELVQRRSPGSDALLVGVSQFHGQAPDLAGVPASLDRIERLWPSQVTRLEEAEATVAALHARAARGELRRYGLIQFSTHGKLVAASGLFAHLKLADRELRYDDVVALDLAGTLVVLAACEGAAGEILPGDEVLSLSRAFLSAGARDVLASEWKLYDKVVPQLIQLLYEGLVAGLTPPDALARAQRSWLERSKESAELEDGAPLLWASLTALGSGIY